MYIHTRLVDGFFFFGYGTCQMATPTGAPLPGVPPSAGFAPGSTSSPPSLRWAEAREAEMAEDHTDCFHIRSLFLTKSAESAAPPAHPPAMFRMASTLAAAEPPSLFCISAPTLAFWPHLVIII